MLADLFEQELLQERPQDLVLLVSVASVVAHQEKVTLSQVLEAAALPEVPSSWSHHGREPPEHAGPDQELSLAEFQGGEDVTGQVVPRVEQPAGQRRQHRAAVPSMTG